jgi:hypothetical protein
MRVPDVMRILRFEPDEVRIAWLVCAACRDDSTVTLTPRQLAAVSGLTDPASAGALDRLSQLGLLEPVRVTPEGRITSWHLACSFPDPDSSPDPLPDPEKKNRISDPEKKGGDRKEGSVRGGNLDPSTPEALMAVWNQTVRQLPPVAAMNAARRRAARARLAEHPPPFDWAATIRRLEASAFCTGRNDRSWRANFDFWLRPTTILKVLEGIYDDRPAPPVSSRNLAATDAWLAARRRARGE